MGYSLNSWYPPLTTPIVVPYIIPNIRSIRSLDYSSYSLLLTQTPKGSKKWNPPNMNPVLLWGNKGIIRGFHLLDPLRGFGKGTVVFLGPFWVSMLVSGRLHLRAFTSSPSQTPVQGFRVGLGFRV